MNLKDKREEDYDAPPAPAYVAYAGEGKAAGCVDCVRCAHALLGHVGVCMLRSPLRSGPPLIPYLTLPTPTNHPSNQPQPLTQGPRGLGGRGGGGRRRRGGTARRGRVEAQHHAAGGSEREGGWGGVGCVDRVRVVKSGRGRAGLGLVSPLAHPPHHQMQRRSCSTTGGACSASSTSPTRSATSRPSSPGDFVFLKLYL